MSRSVGVGLCRGRERGLMEGIRKNMQRKEGYGEEE